MSCRTYQTRHVPAKTDLPRFDKYFFGNEGFIRPLRIGQQKPKSPADLSEGTKSYLVQDLDGEWLASVTTDSIPEIFAEIEENDGVPVLMH